MASPYFYEFILPIRPNLQDEKYDCGAASLRTIVETLGIDVREHILMRLTNTTPKDGASHTAIVSALELLEIQHEVIPNASIELVEQKVKMLNLCLVDYEAWFESKTEFETFDGVHYSVIFGFNSTHFWLADPSKHRAQIRDPHNLGVRTIEKELFNSRWIDGYTDRGMVYKKWMVAVPLYQIY